MSHYSIEGNIVDIPNRTIYPGIIHIENGVISNITDSLEKYDNFILPGFIDSHIHIESSMLIPSEFAKIAVQHGTVATVSDPHEIANVCGMKGIDFMINNGKKVPFHFFFGAPSCVPATTFETSGAEINSEDIEKLMQRDEIFYLSEMMNYPGVIYNDEEVHKKIKLAHHFGKPVDGHAPGLSGFDLDKYLSAGISTDHEAFTFEEGKEKILKGMKILIREGSAAKNYDSLIPLLKEFPKSIMFCSDDKHPDDLMEGHINQLVVKSIKLGYDLFDVLYAACIHPIEHYKLPVGCLKVGDSADFISVENLKSFKIEEVYIKGLKVFEKGISKILSADEETINQFNIHFCHENDFKIQAKSKHINCINIIEGQLITKSSIENVKIEKGHAVSDVSKDIVKMVVLNRYFSEKPAICFVKNSHLKTGAFASTVAHDSHNIIAIGVDDLSISRAINLLIESKGGISYASESDHNVLALPVAGLMSLESAEYVSEKYKNLTEEVRSMGTVLHSPYMTLSFLALLVIPQLKLSNEGLFDGGNFRFTELFID